MTAPEREALVKRLQDALQYPIKFDPNGWTAKTCGLIREAIEALSSSPAVTVTEGWQPIETAPKDGTEVLLFREDGGIFLGRYISMIDFLTDSEAAHVPMETLEQEDWFYADFLHGGRLEGDQVPTHWQAMPSPPSTTPQTGSQE